ITSADTWAALALMLRNLVLNWLVLLPLLCIALLLLKIYAVGVGWFSQFSAQECTGTTITSGITVMWTCLGAVSLALALWFTHTQRPAHCASRAQERGVVLGSVLPALLSAVFFTFALALPCAHDWLFPLLSDGKLLSALGLVCGIGLYLIAWLLAL